MPSHCSWQYVDGGLVLEDACRGGHRLSEHTDYQEKEPKESRDAMDRLTMNLAWCADHPRVVFTRPSFACTDVRIAEATSALLPPMCAENRPGGLGALARDIAIEMRVLLGGTDFEAAAAGQADSLWRQCVEAPLQLADGVSVLTEGSVFHFEPASLVERAGLIWAEARQCSGCYSDKGAFILIGAVVTCCSTATMFGRDSQLFRVALPRVSSTCIAWTCIERALTVAYEGGTAPLVTSSC